MSVETNKNPYTLPDGSAPFILEKQTRKESDEQKNKWYQIEDGYSVREIPPPLSKRQKVKNKALLAVGKTLRVVGKGMIFIGSS